MSADSTIEFRDWTLCILAGGRSRRMGRDKSLIDIGGRTLLQQVLDTATAVGAPVPPLVIRQDSITSCGPLGGILTGLQQARTRWCLFLSCDMPLLEPLTLRQIMSETERRATAVCARIQGRIGFPLSAATSNASAVQQQIEHGRRALRELVQYLPATPLDFATDHAMEFLNVNTPDDLRRLRDFLGHPQSP